MTALVAVLLVTGILLLALGVRAEARTRRGDTWW